MSRYIDADVLIDDLIHNRSFYPAIVASAIKNTPTADVAEVRHGKWVWKFNLDDDDFFECSVCGRQVTLNGLCARRNASEHFPYCHCGAKMDGERSKNGT